MQSKNYLAALALLASVSATAQVVINVDVDKKGPRLSPVHYGIFYEDINHAADGGIYAELIRNRSFEDSDKEIEGWSTVTAGGSAITPLLVKTDLLNKAQGQALQLDIKASAEAPVRLTNEGFWGINAVQGRTYKLSFWVRGNYKGGIKAVLCDKEGTTTYAETAVEGKLSGKWTKLTATLKSDGNDPKAAFALVFDGKGRVALDVVSLFPPTFRNRENGLRPDLAQMLYNMHPRFMRFPGGCFVEGQVSPDNAFRWERTIGPIEERPGHWNVNWGYRTTDGLGFHEYLQMAEDLEAKPLYVVNVGLWHGGLTPVDSLQPWIDECLAALEYANGPVTSKYGAMRAKNGHPEPFNIEYLEIGNENNQPDPAQQSDRYYERFKKFKDAILAKYPDMHLIGNVVAWGDDNPKWESDESVEYVDEHYYRSPAWFTKKFHHYDNYSRKGPKVYCGEYAVTAGFGNLGNMNAALGEAVFMMGMENNADVVEMNSYAPIFVNENDAKWRPDMIRFNSRDVMGTPSYYVQALLAEHVGTQMVASEQQCPYVFTLDQRVTPLRSRYGFATWATSASFESKDALEPVSGEWADAGSGVWKQTSNREQCVAISPEYIDSDHYTLSFRARKDAGAEGFMIVFNYVDRDNYCWLNLGGWNNTQHGIERVKNGGKWQVATAAGSIEQGRWYDVKLTVAGDSVTCWLDGKEIFNTVMERDVEPGVFSNASVDENSGEVIVKVVNTSATSTTAQLNLSGKDIKTARVIRLKANDGEDENTLQVPTAIVPVESSLSPEGSTLTLDVPAYSLNIVRMK